MGTKYWISRGDRCAKITGGAHGAQNNGAARTARKEGLYMAYRDEVFVAGGQPTITYVDRQELHVERSIARALATPNQIVSLAGPTKTGKTVLCKKMLGSREYIWVDGGQVGSAAALWEKIATDLNVPAERTSETGTEHTVEAGIEAVVVTATGSRLSRSTEGVTHRVDGMSESLQVLQKRRIVLVIDDFHYIEADARTEIIRNLKGAIFNGLKVLLLSVAHRVFDAISAESELTGRFISVTLPEWTHDELRQIATLGFRELKIDCPENIIDTLVEESQSSPFLMQKFCWEICFDNDIEKTKLLGHHHIPAEYDLREMFARISKDAGLPIYQKLVTGPQARKERVMRPLKNGGDADIYEATLLALAETGPQPTVSYEDLRAKLNSLLTEMMPQKHEITSALKHLSTTSMKGGLS